MKKHSILFTRHDALNGVTNAITCTFETPDSAKGTAQQLLEVAVTKWTAYTAEGREAWEVSGEDLNIADLACAAGEDDLRPGGVFNLQFQQPGEFVSYDRVLAQPDES